MNAQDAAAKWLAVSRLRLMGRTNIVETCPRCGLTWDVDSAALCTLENHDHDITTRPASLDS